MTLARGRVPASRMNKIEEEYEALFLGRRPHLFEAVTLILADDLRYTPDFLVIAEDHVVELHETKGFWREDAKLKIRMAARLFPWFRFKAFRKLPKAQGGGWAVEYFGAEDAA